LDAWHCAGIFDVGWRHNRAKDYKPGVGALVNSLNDVRVIGDALKAVGFEVLSPVHNARRAEMLLAIHAFAARLKTARPNARGIPLLLRRMRST
jgi:hypothetical protein